MFGRVRKHVEFVRSAIRRPVPKVVLGIWAILSCYDLAVSQLLPPEYAQHFPKAWELAVKIASYIPDWSVFGWLTIFAILLLAIVVEYALRVAPQAKIAEVSPSKPIAKATPKYAAPPGQTYESMAALSNPVLGEYLVQAGSQILKFQITSGGDNHKLCKAFMAEHAPIFFGLYQEALRRDYENSTLSTYFTYPSNIQNRDSVRWIGQEMQQFGLEVKLRA